MTCPTCGATLERPTKAAFRHPRTVDGVVYRAKDCRRCLHTYLTAELVLTPEKAEVLETLLERMDGYNELLEMIRGQQSLGTEGPAS